MLKKINRLRLKKDIETLMKQGQAVYFLFFLLKFKKNGLEQSRFTVITSSKVHKRATKRNLAKRRIREIIRLNQNKIAKGFDVAVIVSPKIIDKLGKVAKYQEIEKELISALKKARLL
jgi:ribonuclease P protein component